MWLAPLAVAGDSWYDPEEGVRYLFRDESDNEIFVAEIDLCGRGISLRATDVDERQQTVSDFGGQVGAAVAINGDFFSYDSYYPSGIGLGAGNLWNEDPSNEGFYVFGADTAWFSPPSETWSSLEAGMEDAVGGRPQLLDAGELTYEYDDPSHCSELNPRTAMGMSEDGQTLWLVVVDGRRSDSDGMTCEALAELMQDLGAWTALNLDGGGSSTLWFDAYGVVNEPSDGSERVVANHLAVGAAGSGLPDSCDMHEAELIWDAASVGEEFTDVDGDGRADACARAAAGWRCYPATESGFGELISTEKFSDENGWSDPTNHASMRMPDLDGDGRADLCGRGDGRLYCALSTGSGWGDTISGPEISDDAGYEVLGASTSLRFGDIDADGDQDACARNADGVRCWPWIGDGFGDAVDGPTLSDASGWGPNEYGGSLRMGDVDGDGRDDLCARAAAGMRCWLSDGASVSTQIEGPTWSDEAGWDALGAWSSIRLADLDGDGRADLCGRGPEGVECALGGAEGFGAAFAGPTLSDASGWGDHDNYATIRLGDVDADGDLDLCARATAGMRCWPYTGSAFGEAIEGPALSDDAGWADPRYYSTIRLGDLDGDQDADLCARASDGLRCWLAPDFDTEIAGPTWSDGSGWDGREYLSTLRFSGGIRATPVGDSGGDGSDPEDSGGPGVPGATVRSGEVGCGCANAPQGGALIGILAALSRGRRRWGWGLHCGRVIRRAPECQESAN